MKNKVGAQKGAFIKMKQKNSHIYQRIYVVCYVPIIGTISNSSQDFRSSDITSKPFLKNCFPAT